MRNPWFRLYSKIMTDPKIEMLSFDDQRHFIWILCMKNEGYLDEIFPKIEMKERMISRKLGLNGEAFENAKRRLLEVNLIDENWNPVSWDLLQFKSDTESYNAEKQRKYRENKKALLERYDGVTTGDCKRYPPDTDTDTDTELLFPKTSFSNEKDDKRLHLLPPAPSKKNKKQNVKIPYSEIAEIFHKTLPEFGEVYKLTDMRKKRIAALWNDKDELPTLADWEKYFRFVRQSKFLMGQAPPSKDRPVFKCTIDFLIHPTRYIEITERKYHDRKQTQAR